MKNINLLRASLCAASLFAAMPALAATAEGQITAIYVELESGVRAERSGRSIEAGMPLLADVRIAGHEGEPARTVLVRMEDFDAPVDDQVEINLGESGHLTRQHFARELKALATASGNEASGRSCERSCSQAKNRTNGRRRCVKWSRIVPRSIG